MPLLLAMPDLEETTVRVIPHGDRWIHMGKHWMILHVIPRNVAYIPKLEDGELELSTLVDTRITLRSHLNGNT